MAPVAHRRFQADAFVQRHGTQLGVGTAMATGQRIVGMGDLQPGALLPAHRGVEFGPVQRAAGAQVHVAGQVGIQCPVGASAPDQPATRSNSLRAPLSGLNETLEPHTLAYQPDGIETFAPACTAGSPSLCELPRTRSRWSMPHCHWPAPVPARCRSRAALPGGHHRRHHPLLFTALCSSSKAVMPPGTQCRARP